MLQLIISIKIKNSAMFDKAVFLEQAVEVFPQELKNIHSCLILVPHPDDESLGCGGLIAMLRDRNVEVEVLVTTDGSQSHPNSKAFPPDKVKLIRKKEVLTALEILGVDQGNVTFLEGKDTCLPSRNQKGFEDLCYKMAGSIKRLKPQLILVPYELDPHCDHRATWQLLDEALNQFGHLRVWEYPIWLYELASEEDIPKLKSGELKRLNISRYLNTKLQAIHSHVSQTTKLIDDDPNGFILTHEMIGHFTTDFEYFIERR